LYYFLHHFGVPSLPTGFSQLVGPEAASGPPEPGQPGRERNNQMSMQQAALPPRAGGGPLDTAGARTPTSGSVAGIRRQAADIVDEVLSGTDPHQARARNELRRLMAEHPGSPETALAEDLLRIRGLTLVPDARPDRRP
jgi:hypothetical protein